jgi:hypothetical protein
LQYIAPGFAWIIPISQTISFDNQVCSFFVSEFSDQIVPSNVTDLQDNFEDSISDLIPVPNSDINRTVILFWNASLFLLLPPGLARNLSGCHPSSNLGFGEQGSLDNKLPRAEPSLENGVVPD